jgi:tetratricopeptide (TPR) repeat protein
MRPAILALLLAAALAAARPAAGQPADAAQRHFERGEALYVQGRYDEAIEELTHAYELSRAPELLFNIAQAHRMAGRCREAVIGYETYLRRAPRGRRAADARALLAELGPCADAPASAAASPPIPEPTAPPPPPALATSPRTHSSVRDGSNRPRPDRRPPAWTAWLTLAAASAAGAAGAWFSLKTIDPDLSIQDARSASRAANTSYAVAGIAAAGATALFVWRF